MLDAESKPVMVRAPPCIACKNAKIEMKMFIKDFKAGMDRAVKLRRKYRMTQEFYVEEWKNRPESNAAAKAVEMDSEQREALEVLLHRMRSGSAPMPRKKTPVVQNAGSARSSAAEHVPAVASADSGSLAELRLAQPPTPLADDAASYAAAAVERGAAAPAPAAVVAVAASATTPPPVASLPSQPQPKGESTSSALVVPVITARSSDPRAVTIAGENRCSKVTGTGTFCANPADNLFSII